MEVIAGVSSILQVIDSVTRVAKRLNEVRESYNNVALNTALVEGQLFTIRAALEALYEWRASDRDSSRPSKQLDKDLGMSLSCCAILISVIDGKLDESGFKPGLKQKIRYLWLEDILKEYISNLEGQVRALQLLLTIFQCRTEAEKRQKIDNEESRTIMEQMRAETASLALDNRELPETGSILSLDPSVTFDIDSILMKSPAYKRVYGNARLRLLPVDGVGTTEDSEQAARAAPTPAPLKGQTPQPPSFPSRPAQNPMPQSRGRINVWSYYPSEGEEEGKSGDGTTMADPNAVCKTPGEIQVSRIALRQNEQPKEVQNLVLQHEEIAIDKVDEDVKNVKMTDVEPSIDSGPEKKPLSMQTEHIVVTAPPAVVDDNEPVSILKGFLDQLNLAFAEKSPFQDDERDLGISSGTAAGMVAVPRDEVSHHSKSGFESLGLAPSHRKSLSEEFQRPISTHSSLYKCSIVPDPQDQSTGTSSPYSCDSCKNIGVTDSVSENGLLGSEPHDLGCSSLQSESESANVQQDAADKTPIDIGILNQKQQDSVSGCSVTSNESRLRPPTDVLRPVPNSTTIEQHTCGEDIITYSAAPSDNLSKSSSDALKRVESTPPVAGLGLQRVDSSEPSGAPSQKIEETRSGMHPPRRVASMKPSALNPPAVVSFPLDEPRVSDPEQSTFSSDKRSSAHDATSTISSSEPPQDSTISSLHQSTSNTTATSVTTHAPGLDLDQNLPDYRRLQNEFATAKARGDSRAVQDALQRSIETISRKRPAEAPAKDNNAPKHLPGLRLGRARSNIMRFSSILGSAKGAMLGDSAASGDTSSVQDLLQHNVNVDSRSDDFKTPLMRSAINGHIECMKLLKQFGADEVAVDAKGRTALHIAVASNQSKVVQWLLKSFPPPNTDLLRHRPSILFRATDAVKGVRSQKNLREASDAEGSKPLHIAAELDKADIVKTLLAAGVDIESKDNWGRTSFHRAIISRSRESFDALLENGAQIAAVDAKSVSSLHLAAEAGQVDMIEILLANGAKRWDFDADGNQPIHSAVSAGNSLAIETLVTERIDLDKRTKSGRTLLHLACLNKDHEVATYLLTKLVDVNPWAAPSAGVLQGLSHSKIKGSSMTPLHYACCSRDFEMAVLLLDHEALINAPTPEGATALMMAVETEDTNMVNLLLQRGAKVNAKIPGSLITALHLAARRGDLETVQQLCRKGADFNARTGNSSYNKNPLEECLKCPDKGKAAAVAEYLRTVVINKRNNARHANSRSFQASRAESLQSYYTPSGAQISPPADPISHGPWARTQQGNVAQRVQAQTSQYYHPDFDVPDEILPAYEPGPSVPARLAYQAPVHREYNV